MAIGSVRLLFREEIAVAAGAGAKVAPAPLGGPARPAPACRRPYRRGDLFCRECGAQVAAAQRPAPGPACAACGAAVPLPARFCNACGAALASDGQRMEGPEPASEPAHRDTQPVPVVPDEPPRAAGSMAVLPDRKAAPRRAPAPEAPPAASVERSQPRERRAEPGARRPPAPAEPARRLAAFVVDAVVVLAGQAALLAPVGWYWWAREAPRTPSDVSFLPVLASAALVSLALLLGVLYHVWFWSGRAVFRFWPLARVGPLR